MPRTPADNFARAQEALANGFTSEAAKKDILAYAVGAAYEDGVDRSIRDKILAAMDAGELMESGSKLHTLYWGIPAISNWRPKHDAMFSEFPNEVILANLLVALRNDIKAAPLIARKPTKKSIEDAARLAVAKTCQICGRPILAETGVIAHHGYQRPGEGWQTASCYGARELPFEVSRDCLGKYIVALKNDIVSMKTAYKAVRNETAAVNASYTVRVLPDGETRKWKRQDREVHFRMTRATFAAMKADHPAYFARGDRSAKFFDAFKDADLASRAGEINNQIAYMKRQQGRYDGWKAIAC